MAAWKELTSLSDAELSGFDIAEVNLACAEGLPGAEKIDVALCRNRLDDFSRCVREYTEPRLERFRRNPSDFENSEAYFRILILITVLQRDLGVRYNPAKIPQEVPLDVEDSFIHGALFGAGGTCASMPVVYLAVGRRLDYPLKLVAAVGSCGHYFARWDGPNGDRFNIEGTSKGLSCPPDDSYRTGLYAPTADLEQRCCLLKSMTPREELASFLKERGLHWKHLGNFRKAVESFAWAYALTPHNEGLQACFGLTMNDWHARLESSKPAGFPPLYFHWPSLRRLPHTVPERMERDMLLLEATENVLKDPEPEQKWWAPLRRRIMPARRPVRGDVSFTPSGGCNVRFQWVQRH
jgi:hypothetical protein